MSNVPKQIPSIKAFTGSPLHIRLDMYNGFIDRGSVFEVFSKGVKKFEVIGVYDIANNRITADFSVEQIGLISLIADVRIRFGESDYPLSVQIKPTDQGSPDGVVGYTIQLSGDSYTVIEILGLDLVEAQVAIATQKAEQTAEDRAQTTLDRVAVESAKDQVIGPLARKLDLFVVDSFADLEAHIANPDTEKCGVLVLSDESYGGLSRLHIYTGATLIQLVSY